MDVYNETKNLIIGSGRAFWDSIAGYVPQLIGAFLLIAVGAFVAKIAAELTKSFLKFIQVDKIRQQKTVSDTLKHTNLSFDPVKAGAKLVFWLVLIIFSMAAADVLGLSTMRDVIREILAFLPNVFAAIIVLTVTFIAARLVKGFVQTSLERLTVGFARPIAVVAQVTVAIFGIVLTLAQLNFEVSLLTANLTVIVTGIMLAAALAFGLGSKELAGSLVGGWQLRRHLNRNDTVEVAGEKVKVSEVTLLGVVVETSRGKRFVSYRTLFS